MKDIDIGHGVTIRWIDGGNGLHWKHPGCRAWSYLYFKPDQRSTGHVLSAGGPDDSEHITIVGSLLCPGGCGAHGHITNGRWEPC
jgi:hypothetical protein